MSLSRRERWQQTQPGRVARRAESMAKRRLEAWSGCLNEAMRGGPTFGRRRALSIRGFRARFLRSVIGGGLQGRFWNIHKEPLRTAASTHPSFWLQEEMGSSVFLKIPQRGTQMDGTWPHDKFTRGTHPTPTPIQLCPHTRVIRQRRTFPGEKRNCLLISWRFQRRQGLLY